MSYYITTATRKLDRMKKRIRAVPGGSSAGKTIGINQILIDLAQRDKTPTVTSIVSESLPHLKRGAERDFLDILKQHDYYDDNRWNKTGHTYEFETGSIIEFFGVDELEKVRGPRRKRLFINEANRVPFETFEQLEIRTEEFVFLDWNPSEEFWYYTEVKGKRDDVEEVVLTYKDNEGLSPDIVRSLEQRQHRKEWWKVYGLGQLGEVEGLIYKGWQIIDSVPFEAKLVRYWVDFGYSKDPCSIGAIYSYNGGYILDEIAYSTGMSNRMIADVLTAEMENRGVALVIADSSEPKSIDEIAGYGITIVGAVKGPDSVSYGIRVVQDQQISLTKVSVSTIKEYRNFLWLVDRHTGKILPAPDDSCDNHCFTPGTEVFTENGYCRIDKLPQKGKVLTRGGVFAEYFDVRPTRKNADVLRIQFDDGNILSVTPDHLLLMPSGDWIEAQLLKYGDLIQSATYESNCNSKISGSYFSSVQWLKIFQRVFSRQTQGLASSVCLGNGAGGNSTETPYSSQGCKSGKQPYFKSRMLAGICSFVASRIFRRAEGGDAKKSDRESSSTRTEVAWIKRGEGVALATWQEDVCNEETSGKGVCSLSQEIQNTKTSEGCAVLPPELQNESKTKAVVGITRRREDVTWNLEVLGTHCLWANGVIAHNSMDGIRYAITSLEGSTTRQTSVRQYRPKL